MVFPSPETHLSDAYPQDYLSQDMRPLQSMSERIALGGSNISVGYLTGNGRVHVATTQTRGDLRRRGLLDIGIMEDFKDPIPGRDSTAMNYYLSGGGGKMTAAVCLDAIMVQQDLEGDFDRGRDFWYGFPSPTFISAVKAAKARPEGVLAARVPVLSTEDVAKPGAKPFLYWFLLKRYGIPRGLEDTINESEGMWARQDDPVRRVLRSPATQRALEGLDKVAFPIAQEVAYYANFDRGVRKVRGAGRVAMRGVGFAFMFARGLLGGDPSDVDFDFSSTGDNSDLGAYDALDGVDALSAVSLEAGRDAAVEIGREYGRDVYFSGGRVVSTTDRNGMNITLTFSPTSSYAKGPDGTSYYMNQLGYVRPV